MDLLIAPNTVTQAQSDQAPATGTPGWATDGNPATNTPATIFPAYAFNALQAELTAAIQGAGITLDRTKLNQLAAAIQNMTQGASAITAPDSGAANAYAISLNPAPAAYTPGMMVAIDNIVATNTGASTLNVNGLGALPIQFAGGAALQGGELVATKGALLRLNHGGTAWTLLVSTGISAAATPASGDNTTKTATTAFLQASMLGGTGQAWTPLSGSRVLGTNYTNSTGRPIVVYAAVVGTVANSTVSISITVNGVAGIGGWSTIAGSSPGNYAVSAQAVIPPGGTYSVNATQGSLNGWAEFR